MDKKKDEEMDHFPNTILEEHECVSYEMALLDNIKNSSLATFYSLSKNFQESSKNCDDIATNYCKKDSTTLTKKSTSLSNSSLEIINSFEDCYTLESIPNVIDVHVNNPYESLNTEVFIVTTRDIQLNLSFMAVNFKQKCSDKSYSTTTETNQFFEFNFGQQNLGVDCKILDKIVDGEISVKTTSDLLSFDDPLSTTSAPIIYNAPKFLKNLSPRSLIYENEEVIFRVSFSGTPLPHITWYYNGNILLDNSFCTILCEDRVSLLRINDCSIIKDDDNLACQINNAVGLEYCETKIVKLKNEKNICNINLKNIYDYQGSSVILLTNNKINITKYINKSLSLDLEKDDVKQYDDCDLLMTEISLENFSNYIPIFIQELPKQIFCLENENIHLKCIYKGLPESVVIWKKNGYLLGDSDKLKIICDDGITILKYYNLTEFDCGTYECQIKNGLGMAKCQCNIIVERNLKNTLAIGVEVYSCKEPMEAYLDILVDEKLLDETFKLSTEKRNFVDHCFSEATSSDREGSQTSYFNINSFENCNDETSPTFIKKLPNMKEIIKGENIDFKVLFIGEPIPNIEWEFDPNAVKGDITKTTEDGVAIFKADNIQSDLTLACIAKNPNGTEKCFCKIVLKPGPDGKTIEMQQMRIDNDLSVSHVTEKQEEASDLEIIADTDEFDFEKIDLIGDVFDKSKEIIKCEDGTFNENNIESFMKILQITPEIDNLVNEVTENIFLSLDDEVKNVIKKQKLDVADEEISSEKSKNLVTISNENSLSTKIYDNVDSNIISNNIIEIDEMLHSQLSNNASTSDYQNKQDIEQQNECENNMSLEMIKVLSDDDFDIIDIKANLEKDDNKEKLYDKNNLVATSMNIPNENDNIRINNIDSTDGIINELGIENTLNENVASLDSQSDDLPTPDDYELLEKMEEDEATLNKKISGDNLICTEYKEEINAINIKSDIESINDVDINKSNENELTIINTKEGMQDNLEENRCEQEILDNDLHLRERLESSTDELVGNIVHQAIKDFDSIHKSDKMEKKTKEKESSINGEYNIEEINELSTKEEIRNENKDNIIQIENLELDAGGKKVKIENVVTNVTASKPDDNCNLNLEVLYEEYDECEGAFKARKNDTKKLKKNLDKESNLKDKKIKNKTINQEMVNNVDKTVEINRESDIYEIQVEVIYESFDEIQKVMMTTQNAINMEIEIKVEKESQNEIVNVEVFDEEYEELVSDSYKDERKIKGNKKRKGSERNSKNNKKVEIEGRIKEEKKLMLNESKMEGIEATLTVGREEDDNKQSTDIDNEKEEVLI
uniref:Ig-like domain-containing protein n=1 Tax=Strongyloides papillosus TaxID=174720 RepID=A0A0N5C0Y1_STREA